MGYTKNKHGVECVVEEEHDNVFIKNKAGAVYLINKTREYADKHGLRIVYETRTGQIIMRPTDRQRRRVNRIVTKARDETAFMEIMKWNGLLKKMRDENVETPQE